MEYQERSAQRAAKSRLGEVRDGPEEDRHAAGRRPRRPHHLHGGAGDFQGAHQAEDSASLGAQGLPEISAARDQQVLHGLAHIPRGARVSHTVWRHRRHGAERRVRGDQGRLPKGRAGFLIQFGVTDDTARSGAYEAIKDDYPRGVPVEEGSICFAAAGPDTRTSTICIFLAAFEELGRNPWETPIGKVCPESMGVLHSIFTGYGDMPQCGGAGPDPILLEERGNRYVRENFPECDFVKSAKWAEG